MAEDKMKNLSRESLAAEFDQTLSILVPHREPVIYILILF